MHRSVSKSTIPSSRMNREVVGQISTHGASSQWLHRSTPKWRRGVGELTALDVLDPGAEDADSDAMLVLARDRARVTSDAAALVDDKAIAHDRDPHPADAPGWRIDARRSRDTVEPGCVRRLHQYRRRPEDANRAVARGHRMILNSCEDVLAGAIIPASGGRIAQPG